jgi:hypothetical protein
MPSLFVHPHFLAGHYQGSSTRLTRVAAWRFTQDMLKLYCAIINQQHHRLLASSS